jgi:transcriptional regulator with XRE-family HTH domain
MYTEHSNFATDQAVTAGDGEGNAPVEFLKAKNISLPHERLENEVIPLGNRRIETVLAEVPISSLKLDPANPRIRYALETRAIRNATQEQLRDLLWENDEVKKLKRSISQNNGLIEAIIIAADGTVLEGNCRATSYFKLFGEAESGDERWSKIRARILPPEVTRETIDELLGELHIAGKNQWTPFEQAAHLYMMSDKGYTQEALAQRYRMSKSYVSAKHRAYALMLSYIELANKLGKDTKDVAQKWSWFEEFYKKIKPSAPGKEDPERVWDGPELEEKFCEWLVEGKLPKAEDVRRLYECLKDPKAMNILDKDGGTIDKAFNAVVSRRPELQSKLWKEVSTVADLLADMGLDDITRLRDGDPGTTQVFDKLLRAVERIKKEIA